MAGVWQQRLRPVGMPNGRFVEINECAPSLASGQWLEGMGKKTSKKTRSTDAGRVRWMQRVPYITNFVEKGE